MSDLEEFARNLISVENELKKKEDEINKVDGEIKSVESSIRLHIGEVLAGQHDDRLSYLYRKEGQLRKEKEQLRIKEAQLRQKELQQNDALSQARLSGWLINLQFRKIYVHF